MTALKDIVEITFHPPLAGPSSFGSFSLKSRSMGFRRMPVRKRKKRVAKKVAARHGWDTTWKSARQRRRIEDHKPMLIRDLETFLREGQL